MRKHTARDLLISVLISLVAIALLAIGFAYDARLLESDIYSAANRTPVEDASATLVINDTGANVRISSRELPAGDVVSVWWLIFNHPEHCEHGVSPVAQCGEQDLPQFGGNPTIDSALLLMTTEVIDESGIGNFTGHLPVQDADTALYSTGLTNPWDAEIHLIIRTHGSAATDLYSEQMQTLESSCQDSQCIELQVAIFGQN